MRQRFCFNLDDGTVATLAGAVSYCGSDCASAGYVLHVLMVVAQIQKKLALLKVTALI